MANDLATAYIQLIPSLKGAQATITQDLTGINLTPAGSSLGGKVSSAMASGLKSTFAVVGTAAAAGIATIGAAVLGGGWDRALQIDSAKVKIETLLKGTSTSVKDVMGDITASVKGTAFSTADAANIAAMALSAGVAPGESLTKILSMTGDAAAISGRSFADMGLIMNSVAGRGKLMGDDLRQLESAGIGVKGALAELTGKSIVEVSEMVSDGKVSFEMFQTAMEKFGGSAVEIGSKTFPGAVANMKSSLARIGASLWDPLIQAAVPAINSITKSMAPLEEAVVPIFSAIGANIAPNLEAAATAISGAIGSITSALSGGGGGLGEFMGTLSGFAPVIGAVTGALGGLLGHIPFVGSAFAGINPIFGTVIGLFVGMMSNSEALRDALGGLFDTLIASVAPLLPTIMELATVVGDLLNVAMGALGDILGQVITALTPLLPIIMDVVNQVISALMPVIQQVIEIIPQIMSVVTPIIDFIMGMLVPVIQIIIDTIMNVFNAIMPVVEPVLNTLQAVIATVIALINGDWEGVWNGILGILQGVWDTIVAVVGAAIEIVSSVISGALDVISSIWNSIWGAISGFFQNIWSVMVSLVTGYIDTVLSTIQSALNAISSIWNSIWSGISSFFSGIWSGMVGAVSAAIDGIYNFVSGIPSTIMGFFANAGQWLLDAGKNIIDGLLNGIKNAVGGVLDFVGGIGQAIMDNKGPEAYDKALLIKPGQWIMQSLGIGLDNGLDPLLKKVSGIAPLMQAALGTSLTATVDAIAAVKSSSNRVNGDFGISGQATDRDLPIRLLHAIENLPREITNAIDGMEFKVGERDFARLTRAAVA